MKVSYQWLKEYVDLSDVTPQELADKLTLSGIAVDVVESLNRGVSKVVVGYVTSKEKHPEADKLSLCRVRVEEGKEELQIVCGAQNVNAGQKVPVALVGATLPGGVKIKRAKLRGIESQGMICSAKELGLKDKLLSKEQQEGILVLSPELKIGTDITEVLGLQDYVLELDLTPNRSDCLSMLGVAYEVAAILGKEVKIPSPAVKEELDSDTEEHVKVQIDQPDHCYRYTARYIENVQLGPSPQWLKNRLMAAGIRPINNVVDITNYVMLEYGQPLHAFDYDEVSGGEIVVRTAFDGEKMVTLDEVERTLDEGMLLITDGNKPVGIAGVMGGANSEVKPSTKKILLESAYFSGPSIRKTSRKLGLRSEASLRFEKGVDIERVVLALDRAAQLMEELAGGKVAKGMVDQYPVQMKPVSIPLRISVVNEVLGTDLNRSQIKSIMDRLQFLTEEEGDHLVVHIPTRRGDITIEADLIEEVARLYGYDEIPTTLPVGPANPGGLTREQHLRRKIKDLLNGMGLTETITYSFTDNGRSLEWEGIHGHVRPIPLTMPMSEERSVLRTSLVPHLLESAAYNINRQQQQVALFEMGRVYLAEEETLTKLPDELLHLAGLITGPWVAHHWVASTQTSDFYLIKGMLEELFDQLGVTVRYQSAVREGMHPGRTANIWLEAGGKQVMLGYLGQVHPVWEGYYDLDETYVFELNLNQLFSHMKEMGTYTQLPKYPSISRDIAVVVHNSIPAESLEKTIREAAGDLLEQIRLFDVYVGEKIGKGLKSVAFSLIYRHPERTLTDEEVNQLQDKVISSLRVEHGGELR
ncbi:phenylalanine--tRNA ligase subunit beta [Microaerobacter geothermalis]|uniref:phenylalanine--tRNA ligase subunit beta n=1 Tax=Microaerobacter geothermalis TaxID=674972 RepID=UPI001F3640E5|nr:phenylalanine--tRNA ligase subunit beta [Microaerobacter geothermalis]MCF6092514.1 phenylalanine--tRNA ligase subunit beta [Microaerobacter geothermalis]